MERKFKFSWRVGFNGAQKKAFSRWRRVMKLMTEEKEALGPVFLDELDWEFGLLTGFEKKLIQQKLERATTAAVEQAESESEQPTIGLD